MFCCLILAKGINQINAKKEALLSCQRFVPKYPNLTSNYLKGVSAVTSSKRGAVADAETVSTMIGKNTVQNAVNFFCIGFSFKKRASACALALSVNLSSIAACR